MSSTAKPPQVDSDAPPKWPAAAYVNYARKHRRCSYPMLHPLNWFGSNLQHWCNTGVTWFDSQEFAMFLRSSSGLCQLGRSSRVLHNRMMGSGRGARDQPAVAGQQHADQTPEKSSSGSGSTSESMTERIVAAIRDIEQEEAQLWRDYKRMGRFPYFSENHQTAELGFDVFRTPCGKVYQSSRTCTQLQGPRTGFARKFQWCELCKEVAMRTQDLHCCC